MLIALRLQQMLEQQARAGQAGQQRDTLGDIQKTVKTGRDIYNAGKDLYKLGESAYEAIAGADAATKAEGLGNSATTASDAGSSGGTMAAVMSVINSGRRFANTSRDEQQAYEAAMAAPRAIAAYYTLGGSELAEGFARKQWGGTMKKFDKFMMNSPGSPVFVPMQASKLWTSDKWKKEGNRVKNLLEAGVEVPEQFRGRMYQQRGLKKSELLNPNYDINFQGMTPDGYVNNKFENSRNEADMTYETLAPYAVWAEKRNDWWKLSDAQRRAITDAAQKAGAIREHHGTVDVDWDKVGDIDQLIKGAPGAQAAVRRPGKGQVARVSPGMYMNDQGRVGTALTSNDAMRQNYGNRIPRSNNKR
jgi:hypothetical protein